MQIDTLKTLTSFYSYSGLKVRILDYFYRDYSKLED
jgi:hypothetical protein